MKCSSKLTAKQNCPENSETLIMDSSPEDSYLKGLQNRIQNGGKIVIP